MSGRQLIRIPFAAAHDLSLQIAIIIFGLNGPHVRRTYFSRNKLTILFVILHRRKSII